MKSQFKESFKRDLEKVQDHNILLRIKGIIANLEQDREILELEKFNNNKDYFKIPVADYRMGLIIQKDTVNFVRFIHRKDITRFFIRIK